MFTGVGIACSIIAVMIGTILMTCIKLFSRIHPFHLAEHRATVISLLFMSAITISTLIECILMSIRIFPQTDINAFLFANSALIAFVCIWCITLPDSIPEKSAEDRDTHLITFFGRFCIGIALFFEILATVMFYSVWTHA
jgi:uncharacterized membrane protein YqjE